MKTVHPDLFAASAFPSSPVVSALLQCVAALESSGHHAAAEQACRAAVLSDDGVHSRLALAELLSRRERWVEAAREYEQLLTTCRGGHNLPLLAVVTHNLAAVLRHTGATARARALQAHSAGYELDRCGMPAPEDLSGFAVDAIEEGDLSRAEDLLLRSAATEKARGNLLGAAGDWINLGAIALLRGRLAEAIRFLGRAAHTHRRFQSWYGAGVALTNLAEAFQRALRPELATKCRLRAARCFAVGGARRAVTVPEVPSDS